MRPFALWLASCAAAGPLPSPPPHALPSLSPVFVAHTHNYACFRIPSAVQAPSGAERRMLATNIYRKLEGRWVLVHHHASQAMVRGNSIEDLLGGASSARVIRIDGSLRDSDGASSKADSSADDIVDEIVRALQVCPI